MVSGVRQTSESLSSDTWERLRARGGTGMVSADRETVSKKCDNCWTKGTAGGIEKTGLGDLGKESWQPDLSPHPQPQRSVSLL